MTKQELLIQLYYSFLDARRHKKQSQAYKGFEKERKRNLILLCEEIYNEKYQVSPSFYFIQQKPVKREIFASNFRDRIVHHLIYRLISPYREKQFIYDSYSCRKEKGPQCGIERMQKFMRSCSQCYTQEGWILKLDIQGYFMAIEREILRKKISNVLYQRENLPGIMVQNPFHFLTPIQGKFPEYLLKIIHDTIFNDPIKNAIFKGKKSDYEGLPPTKSLFFSKKGCGLPIGNLTSQLFSNIYLNSFDHFIKEDLKIRYYGRYVDDFILIHQDKEKLKNLIPHIRTYLETNLHLVLHPKKIYLQPISHGVEFLGAIIKPFISYRSKRTLINFCQMLKSCNYTPSREALDSYVGLIAKHKNYYFLQKILKEVHFELKDISSEFSFQFLSKENKKTCIEKNYSLNF